VIFALIGHLPIGRTGGNVLKERFDHIGDQRGGQAHIDWANSRRQSVAQHAVSLQWFAAAEQFAVDAANLLEDILRVPVVVQVLVDLRAKSFGHILFLWLFSRMADGQVEFWSMSSPSLAVAIRVAAALVGFEKRATHEMLQAREFP
jgi:hypothetical protein